MPESVQSCFELSIRLSVFFSRELFLVVNKHTCDKARDQNKPVTSVAILRHSLLA